MWRERDNKDVIDTQLDSGDLLDYNRGDSGRQVHWIEWEGSEMEQEKNAKPCWRCRPSTGDDCLYRYVCAPLRDWNRRKGVMPWHNEYSGLWEAKHETV